MFLVFALAVWTALHLYVWSRANGLLHLSGTSRALAIGLLVLLASSYFLGHLVHRAGRTDAAARWLLLVGDWWMGALSILLSILLLVELASAVVFVATLIAGRGHGLWTLAHGLGIGTQRAVAGGVAALVAGSLAVGFMQARDGLEVTRFQLQIPNLPPAWHGKRLVQISDVHLGLSTLESSWDNRLQRLAELQPDILLVTGDLVDDRSLRAQALVDQLAARVPFSRCYAVTGNHESYVGTQFFLERMNHGRCTVLRQQAEALAPHLYLGGIDDRHYGDEAEFVERMLKDVPEDASLLVLAHRPTVADELAHRPKTLVMSGHLHGGQVPPFQLLSPIFNRGFLSGLVHTGAALVYVSRGTGTWGPPIRLFARPEIVTYSLRAGESFALSRI